MSLGWWVFLILLFVGFVIYRKTRTDRDSQAVWDAASQHRTAQIINDSKAATYFRERYAREVGSTLSWIGEHMDDQPDPDDPLDSFHYVSSEWVQLMVSEMDRRRKMFRAMQIPKEAFDLHMHLLKCIQSFEIYWRNPCQETFDEVLDDYLFVSRLYVDQYDRG